MSFFPSPTSLPGIKRVCLALSMTWFCMPALADDRFDLKISGQRVEVGKPAKVQIKLTADNPWHMNMEYPTSLKVKGDGGLQLSKLKFRQGDASVLSEHKIVFAIPVTATSAGSHRVQGKIKFAICKADSCSPASAKVDLRIQASAPQPKAKKPELDRPHQPKARPKARPKRRPKPKAKNSRTPKARKTKPAPARACTPRGRVRKAGDAPLCAPTPLSYLRRWMLDPIWGAGMTDRFFSFMDPSLGLHE